MPPLKNWDAINYIADCCILDNLEVNVNTIIYVPLQIDKHNKIKVNNILIS